MIFLSHSHKDQRIAYAISIWLRKLWPALRIFVTSEELSETNQMFPHYYLRMIQECEMLLCVLSERFFTSNELFDELEVADQANLKVTLILAPDIKSNDQFANFEGTIERWEKRFSGTAIDLADADAENALASRLRNMLGLGQPIDWSPGELFSQLSKVERIGLPSPGAVPLPEINRIISGEVTRDDALKSLKIFQKHLDNQARAAGIDPERVPSFSHVPELQLILVFLSSPEKIWPGIQLQCSPLINETFQNWIVHLLQGAEQDKQDKLIKLQMMCQC